MPRILILHRARKRHGLSQTPVYQAWAALIQRCENPKHPHFNLWGGRGITVCPEWRASFEAFYADMGPKPSPLHSIDRIDNDGNYSKENCRWTTKDVNTSNQRRASFHDFRGEKITFKEARRITGLSKMQLRYRLKIGRTIESLVDPSIPYGHGLPNLLPSRESMPEPNGAKRKTPIHITSRISWDTSNGTLTLDWKDGQQTVFNLGELPQNIVNDLAYFGLLGRIQQSYVTSKGSPQAARERAGALWSKLCQGDWGLSRGEKSSSVSITIKALALLLNISEADAATRFAALPVDKRREVSSRSDVVAQVAKLKAKANPLQSLDSILK